MKMTNVKMIGLEMEMENILNLSQDDIWALINKIRDVIRNFKWFPTKNNRLQCNIKLEFNEKKSP